MLDSYRRYKEAESGDRDVLQAARLSSWFCALLSEGNIKPWHLVTVADDVQEVWLREGDTEKTGIGWVREVRDPRWVTYADAGEHHYPRQYFTVAKVTHRRVGYAETIRLDEVIRNWSVIPWPDPMRGPEPLPIADEVEGRHKAPLPALAAPPGARPLACAMGNDPNHGETYHEIPRTPLRVYSAPWGVGDRGGVQPPGYGWASFGQPLCMGHFNAFFDAVDRSWRPIVKRFADVSLTTRQAKAAKELSRALEGREDSDRDPADVAEFDPLVLSGAHVPVPDPEDPPEFDRGQLDEMAAEFGIWELDEQDRMICSWRFDGLTWDDIAQALGVPRKTIYNRRQAWRLLKKISEKSSG
jgi:Homeodomain-like domain